MYFSESKSIMNYITTIHNKNPSKKFKKSAKKKTITTQEKSRTKKRTRLLKNLSNPKITEITSKEKKKTLS